MKHFACILSIAALSSCVSEKEKQVYLTDPLLYSYAIEESAFSFYKRTGDTLTGSAEGQHAPYIRIRFNEKAVSVMDDSVSRLKSGFFPDHSMVVMETFETKGGPLTGLVMMYKLRGAANSESGWVWSRQGSDGTVIYSSAREGEACVACHTSGTNSNLVKTFALH